MVYGTSVAINGNIGDFQIPAKTADVLQYIRKKFKADTLQFQGKIQDPTNESRWLTIFAGTDGEEETINNHCLPAPFNEENYTGPIVILATQSDQQDEHEQSVVSYVNLKADDYKALYEEWTFAEEEEEDEGEYVEEDEEVDDVVVDDEEEQEVVTSHQPTSKVAVVHTSNVFVDCPLRTKVIDNFKEVLESDTLATDLEHHMLRAIEDQAIKENIDVDWANRVFWNTYRSRAISIYENLLGAQSYVQNKENWKEKIVNGEITPKQFAEMTAVDMSPSRWKEALERMIETEKKLYSASQAASIFLWCSSCKKKAKCDYYQMQTRSADEPMTTFVTCLECNRRWKF